MFSKLLDFVLKNWRALALCVAALLIAGFLFYLWAYERGKAACESKVANANLEASETVSKANQDALAKEIQDQAARIKTHTEIKRAIEESHDQNADDPAPDLDQFFYDRLRVSR